MGKVYHVAVSGCDTAEGSREHPFRTISRAASMAAAGDRVVVHEGVYREWVRPRQGGLSDVCRIVYEAAEGEKVVIKGSERIRNWECIGGTVWKTVIPNTFFGTYNPYQEVIEGDWFLYPKEYALHTGEVYLNGKSFFEAPSLEAVKNPVERTEYHSPAGTVDPVSDPKQSLYQWYCESDEENTAIYANFHGADPNEELTEINVRKCCFYPEKSGLNYITIYNIGVKREFFGWEIGGIKFHAAIDAQILHNWIHNCSMGTWLDWQAQGVRVSGNISQGGAFVHNLCCGFMKRRAELDRATLYHFPHITEVAGFSHIYGGDDRYFHRGTLRRSGGKVHSI